MRQRIGIRLVALVVCTLLPMTTFAGGPLVVGGGNGLGNPGQPLTWAQHATINYRVDGGPLSMNGATVVFNNAAGVARVQSLFQTWQNVASASLDIRNAGPILSVPATGGATSFSDGDVSNATEFDAVSRACDQGTQSPIIFDADGNIFDDLGLPSGVIGFASPCRLANGNITSGMAVLNGKFIDTVYSPPNNFELPPDAFDAAFIHEFGHFLGLDHSQINVDCYVSFHSCDNTPSLQGLPTMFPVIMALDQKTLSPDDIAWIHTLYPNGAANYGLITGRIYFSDGLSQAQGVNVIARSVTDPSATAVSVVSGFKFTGNPGQSVTGTNTGGSAFGSRDPMLIGYYEIPVLAGTYTVEVESIDPDFESGSSVGPLSTPIPMPGPREKWHTGQNNHDTGASSENVIVTPGGTSSGKDFILNNQFNRYDLGEDGGSTSLVYPDIGNQIESVGGAA
jgi:hypothetical protein